MAQGKGQDQVAHHVVLVTAVSATAPARLLRVVGLVNAIIFIYGRLHYTGFTIRSLRELTAGLELAFHLWNVILTVLGELHRNLLEDHVVLRKSASLVREKELQPAELLGYRRVSGNGAVNVFIRLNLELIVQFGEVEIDAHGDWDDGTKQQNYTEKLEVPVAHDAVSNNDGGGKRDH